MGGSDGPSGKVMSRHGRPDRDGACRDAVARRWHEVDMPWRGHRREGRDVPRQSGRAERAERDRRGWGPGRCGDILC